MDIKDIISDQEEIEIKKIVSNPSTLNALKKVLLAPIYNEGTMTPDGKLGDPLKNFALNKAATAIQQNPGITDKMLGETLRADTQGMRLIELGFLELNKFIDKKESKGEDENPAR